MMQPATFSGKQIGGLLLLVLMVVAGCSTQMAPEQLRTVAQALEAAKTEAAAGEWEAACKSYDASLTGGLSVDLLIEALLGRALARAKTGNFEGALEDLKQAEPGANPEDVHAMRGLVLFIKGDKAGAQQQFAMARQINPRVKIPTDTRVAAP